MKPDARGAIIIFVVIVALLLILASYGYLTGAWNGDMGCASPCVPSR